MATPDRKTRRRNRLLAAWRLGLCLMILASSPGVMAKGNPEPPSRPDSGLETEWRMPWFTAVPKFGYGFFTNVAAAGRSLGMRHGVIAAVELAFGGSGFSFTIDPLYSFERSRGRMGDFHAAGAETALSWRWDLGRVLPFAGIGFRGCYLTGPAFSHGAELYGRFPVGVTWYAARNLGLDVELGLMYGATGLKGGGVPDFHLGSGFALDLLAGLRFP